MKRQTILFTESSPNVGGQELQCMQQMQQLNMLGYDCTLSCRPNSRVEEIALTKGLKVLRVAFRNSLHVPSILQLCKWLLSNRPVLAVCHSGHDSNNLAIAARLTGVRPFLLRSRTYLAGKSSAWTYNSLVDATMVPSQALKCQLLENPAIQADKVQVVYPGIDFDSVRLYAQEPLPVTVAQWLSSHPGPVLVQAAMLRGEKGHVTVLQALAQLVEKWPKLRYLIAGVGPMEEALRTQIKTLCLEDHVYLCGMVSPVASLFTHADLVLMPSIYEPLGMSQIEALSLAKPVVASDTGGIPETVAHNITGILVKPGDANAWAQAIDLALSSPQQMLALAEAGKADVLNRFSMAANTRAVLEIAGLRS